MESRSRGLRPLILFLGVASVLISGTAPVFGSGAATTGTQLNLIRVGFATGTCSTVGVAFICTGGTTTLPASAPFFVRHGLGSPGATWAQATPQDRAAFLGKATFFVLHVDGNAVFSVRFLEYSNQFDAMTKWFLTNFPSGMTGTHTFTGMWFQDGEIGNLGTPGQPVLELAITITVTFT